MSRIAKNPILLPKGVEVAIDKNVVTVKGGKATLRQEFHKSVEIKQEGDNVIFSGNKKVEKSWAQAGTARAIVNNMVLGVTSGFEKKLQLVGVGYRAQIQGMTLNLTLGYSHPIAYKVPEGISVSTPSQTEIIINGADKAVVGQVAAEIREFRKPEPYKGKGVRYHDEVIIKKEAKKK